MPDLDSPSALQRALASALRDLPGAVELRAFGSLTRDDHDSYSDIDLEILTTTSDASIDARQAVIERVAPILLEWRIDPTDSAWAATILFENLSPWRRLDLGITAVDIAASSAARPEQTIIWRQDAAPAFSVPSRTPAHAPTVGTPEHATLEHLLSATRYVKARKRGQHLTAFRFASALASATFAMLEAERTGDLGYLRQKPSTSTFLSLDRRLSPEDRRSLLALFDFSSPERMDTAVLALLQRILTLHNALPGAGTFPSHIAERLLAFIAEELHA